MSAATTLGILALAWLGIIAFFRALLLFDRAYTHWLMRRKRK